MASLAVANFMHQFLSFLRWLFMVIYSCRCLDKKQEKLNSFSKLDSPSMPITMPLATASQDTVLSTAQANPASSVATTQQPTDEKPEQQCASRNRTMSLYERHSQYDLKAEMPALFIH
ncbi:hypothetical protein BDR26DRAFT_530054 [Obelidium mucronatum]|nr:hypothetical protein BDR26DRAFT_530054 [Obelidium mucronatum]